MTNYGPNLTQKQWIIIATLYMLRGALYSQLINFIEAALLRKPASKSYVRNTYKDLQRLESLRLIVREPIKLNRTKDFIYLTEAGAEFAKDILDISPGHIGTGWDGDYGDFIHELQRPPRPSSAVIHHHLMFVDVIVRLELLRGLHPTIKIDYRDNRYCSSKFELEGQTQRLKPDGEIKINDRRIFIEVDRGNEFGEKLREKFISYKNYLKHLEAAGDDLPEAVLFICNKETRTGMQRRWSLISSVFWNEMSEWRTRFNLITINDLDELETILLRQSKWLSRLDDTFNKIQGYLPGKLNMEPLDGKNGSNWNALFSVVRLEESSRLFVFERVEPFETIGIARIFELHKWFASSKGRLSGLKQKKYFLPVLLLLEYSPFPLYFKGFEDELLLNEIFNTSLWCNTSEDPIWWNCDGEPITIQRL